MGCGTVRQRDLSSTQDRSPAPFDAWCCLLAAKFIIVKYAQLNPSLSGIEFSAPPRDLPEFSLGLTL